MNTAVRFLSKSLAGPRGVAAAAFLMALVLIASPPVARSEDDAACRPIRMVGIAVLKHCGDQVRSMTLTLNDIKRAPGTDMQGRFFFACPIQHMCEDEPNLWGFFVDEGAWRAGARDEAALRELLRHAPGIGAMPESFAQAACDVWTVEVAGLDGRAVCFELAPNRMHAVIVVGAAEDIGFALVFAQPGVGWDLLREKVSAITPKFALQRATGDASLLKWFR
jgi:hypothetical protein